MLPRVFCRAQKFGGEARRWVGTPAAAASLSGAPLLLLLFCRIISVFGPRLAPARDLFFYHQTSYNVRLPSITSIRTAMASLVPGIRRVAFQASSRLFVCNQCLRQAPRNSSPSTILNVVRSRGYSAEATQSTSPLGKLAKEMSTRPPHQAGPVVAKRTFPKTSSKGVAYWLLGSAASVVGIVVFGGLTRLTESG